MSLYWPSDPADVELSAPRLHAFIIGVGDYTHLGLHAARPAAVVNGLAPLTTTRRTALRIAGWLEQDYSNANCPLGSIELLLSPAGQVQRADSAAVAVESATMANIDAAFKRWYERCHAQRDNVAFFYFAGHGLSTLSHFLLAEDFGNPDLPDEWENCIDFSGMRVGMGKCRAQTQLFFVDACRDAPVAALLQRNPHGKPLVTAAFTDRVNLSAAYLAASDGRQAYGRDNEETFFCRALLMCFDGVAARKPGMEWRVDAASLSAALPAVMQTLSIAENLPLSCDCSVQKPVALHFPPNGGQVLASVDCRPATVRAESAVRVSQGSHTLASPAGEKRPWVERLRAGDAQFEVAFTNHAAETWVDQLIPPTYEREVDR